MVVESEGMVHVAIRSEHDRGERHVSTLDLVSLVRSDDAWMVSLGAKFEHNPFTGWEFQPDIQLRWAPDETHVIWSAVSRAVRIPGRIQVDSDELIAAQPGPFSLPLIQQLSGNAGQEAMEWPRNRSPRSQRVATIFEMYFLFRRRVRLSCRDSEPWAAPRLVEKHVKR